jgi:hypothetical protein
MEVITIDSGAYQSLVEKIDRIAEYVMNQTLKENPCSDDEWVDGYEVCTCLRISERTLQRLRTNGEITFSVIGGKTYYTIAEVKRLLKERLVRSNPDSIDELVRQHQEYLELRKKQKPKK